MMLPRARDDLDLIVQPFGDETVVYDSERHDVHQLNRTATLVWRHCDGSRSVDELTALVRDEIASEADESTVLHALEELRGARLLAEDPEPDDRTGGDRRAFLRKMAMYGAPAAVAVVWSLATPTVAHAQSCGGVAPDEP